MQRSVDPALIRLGIEVGSVEDVASAAKVVATLNEVLARLLNLVRLAIVAGPILLQSCFIHTVSLGTWLARLSSLYVLVGVVGMLLAPEQAYNGLALRTFRWVFELIYPTAGCWNGSPAPEPLESAPSTLLRSTDPGDLSGALVRLRWHGTNKYLCLTNEGWAVTGEEGLSARLQLQQVFVKGEKVPDTYTLRVSDCALKWDQAWLSFQPINHLRFGGWLGAFRDESDACPYKILRDSACPPGTCKLLSAWPRMPSVTQRFCTGFYVAEQLCGGELYIGHAPDRDAALLELVRT